MPLAASWHMPERVKRLGSIFSVVFTIISTQLIDIKFCGTRASILCRGQKDIPALLIMDKKHLGIKKFQRSYLPFSSFNF